VALEAFVDLMHKTSSGSLALKNKKGKDITILFNYNAPCTGEDIEKLESEGIELSFEHKSLLMISNGFEIYDYQGIDGFRFFGSNEIPEKNKWISESFGNDWDDTVVIGGKCLGEGAYLGFKKTGAEESLVIDCFLEMLPKEWDTIADSISEFLTKLISVNGDKYW